MGKRDIPVRLNLIIAIAFLSVWLLFIIKAQGKVNEKGVVISIRDGKLEKVENNIWIQLTNGQDVFLGDRLRTDKTAVAIVEFSDIGKFVIGPSSDIEMGKDPKDFHTKMDRGALWLKSNLPKGSRASVTTSLATAGIRGTAFSVIFEENAGCICTCSGKVEVILKNGQSIKVSKGEFLPLALDEPAPEKVQSSTPLLEITDTRSDSSFNRCFKRRKKDTALERPPEETDTGFNFCFNCHLVGGKGKLKQGWK